MTGKSDFKSKTPYQDKKAEHPSMLELKIPRREILPVTDDPYSEIDRFVCSSLSDHSAIECIIGKDEECTGCKTCVRLGF